MFISPMWSAYRIAKGTAGWTASLSLLNSLLIFCLFTESIHRAFSLFLVYTSLCFWYMPRIMYNVCVSHSVVSASFPPPGLCSPPGSSVPGILQARTLEWVAISFSRGSSFPTQELNPGLLHCKQILYQLTHKGSPCVI